VRDTLRLIAGVRVEYSYILLRTFDDQGNYQEPRKNNLDPLPGINLVYSPRRDMNVRAAFSQSVSRPEFRELSPAFYPSPRGLYGQIGNPNLVEAKINSYDLRWEWFFSPLELVSAGVFYKTFDGPIEPFLIQTSGNPARSWTNAKDADLVGFELEARKDLSFFWPTYLRGLSLQTNIAGSDSNVNIPSQSHPNQTLSRPLAGQSPYLINTSLEYVHERWGTFRLLYNIAGRTLYAIGLEQLPNIF